ncbi:MAG: hypothetical protein NZ898_03140 [Myxococcota bacterium]|nr:hypothetical protein [Myxococcota bacterium]
MRVPTRIWPPAVLVLAFVTGACAGGKRRGMDSTRCATDAECEDGVSCTVDVCNVEHRCEHQPLDAACGMGMSCDPERGCVAGRRCASSADCDDGIDCTVDSCGAGNLCRNLPQDSLCAMGERCDPAMDCIDDGGCASDAECDDRIACTVDSCGAGGRCTHTPLDTRCNAGERCVASTGCVATRPCTTAADCDDGNFCNGDEVCMPEFGCTPAERPRACSDGNDCTVDRCDPDANRCVFECDRSRPACGCPTEGPSCTGTFTVSGASSYSCAFGMVSVDFRTLTFNHDAGVLTVQGGGNTGCPDHRLVMEDVMAPVCPEFHAVLVCSGGCNERYEVQGRFTADDRFEGTVSITFTPSPGDMISCALGACANQRWTVNGMRR